MSFENRSTDIYTQETNVEYANGGTPLNKDSDRYQIILDRLNDSVVVFRMRFLPPKRKALLLVWIGSEPRCN